MKPVLVLKVGTAAITNSYGDIDEIVIQEICQQLAVLHQKYRIILVSSGAVGSGKKYLSHFSGSITEKKAAAAIGNPLLLQKYNAFLQEYSLCVAQILCERGHFSNRVQFLQLRETFEELWKNNILPVVNENDAISDLALKFSDNDEVATLLAVGFSAEKILFGSSLPGLLQKGTVVDRIDRFTDDIFALADSKLSEGGLGGMLSKLSCARMATNFGTTAVLFDVRKSGNILRAEQLQTGTVCPAKACNISAHQKWLASGSLPTGKVVVDSGAAQALQKRKSLLLVGVEHFIEPFEKGDIFEIYEKGREQPNEVVAVGKARISSSEARHKKSPKGVEIAHADEIVIF
ncbi:glutamate 5-kinase [Candidatus Gracilibacteria bacterium]|nr:glutamate 5-kinase [Candidatus Gracilibacteria bacterium]MCF7819577.1 glutamate 5-kinase [Candidatus Gracilibacteria bacterium]